MKIPSQAIVGGVAVVLMIAGLMMFKKEPQAPLVDASAGSSNVDAAIQNYIEQHPEVILKSVEQYQERKANEMMAQLSANIKSKKAELEQNAGDPKVGPDGATVKVVEFFDYGCVFCRKMQPIMAKAMQSNPDVQIVFKEMPMFGDASVSAAKAALSVYKIDPSKYYQFHTSLMKTQNSNVSAAAMEVATSMGINVDKLKQAMQDPELDKLLADNRKLATEIGVRGAPAFIINGELVIGLIEQDILQAKIDAAKGVKPEASAEAVASNQQSPSAAGVAAPASTGSTATGEEKKEQTADSKIAAAAPVLTNTGDKPVTATAN